jgi:hypothetical protein
LLFVAAQGMAQPVQPSQPGAAPAGQKLALVIGNSQYANLPPVPRCDASAKVMAAALGRAGFSVTAKANVTNGEMGAALGAFVDAAAQASGADIVVYLCGYAVDFDGRAFLLPASVTLARDSDVLAEGLAGKPVVAGIARINPHAGLLLLDEITRPGSPASVGLDPVIGGMKLAGLGAMSARATGIQPDGSTPLAAGVAAALAQPAVEAGALMATVGHDVAGLGGVTVAMGKPLAAAWLVGGPAPAPPSAPVAPPPDAAPAAVAVPAAPPAPVVIDPATQQRRVQIALQRLGYYDGRIDGIEGPEERAAIRRYQHELGAEMTGTLTPAQVTRLLSAGQ